MKHWIGFSLAVLSVGAVLLGCGGGPKPMLAPGFTGESLTSGGIAVFPAVIGEGSKSAPGVESYLETCGQAMADALSKAQPGLKVITPSQVKMTLATEGLVESFAKMKETYAVAGMVDAKTAQAIVEPLGVKYFMLPAITSLWADSDGVARARVSAKIFDSTDGRVVFEALGEDKAASILGGPPYDRAVEEATEKVTKELVKVYGQK